jgi:prephenate dehydrogenase
MELFMKIGIIGAGAIGSVLARHFGGTGVRSRE